MQFQSILLQYLQTKGDTRFGIKSDHVFPMNDWVGGRFSL